ncbi:MAG: acireductone synthase [Acetobacter sp.]|nr:acireductone synthase [Acetobacter sp.]
MKRPVVALLDIEGTTVPVSFVHKVLFPYARSALPDFLKREAGNPAVVAALEETRQMVPGVEPGKQLQDWIDQDAKVAPLKLLQGLIWAEGYARGALSAVLYPDVVPVLKAWKEAGLTLAVYSSGSEAAQKLIYGHTSEGDQTGLFSAWFDLAVGGKKEAASYRRILAQQNWNPSDVLFLSDVTAELDAAREAGLKTCHIVRPEDGTIAGEDHPVAADLAKASDLFGLPEI